MSIAIKYSNTPGNVPALVEGEIAINQADRLLFTRDGSGNVISTKLDLEAIIAAGDATKIDKAALITDWNLAITEGFYYAASTASNTPVASPLAGLVITRTTNHIIQIVFSSTASSHAYIRYCVSGVWGAWGTLQDFVLKDPIKPSLLKHAQTALAINPNSSFEGGTDSWTLSNGAVLVEAAGTAANGANLVRLAKSDSVQLVSADFIPISVSKPLRTSFTIRGDVASANGFRVRMYWYKDDKTAASTTWNTVVADGPITTDWVETVVNNTPPSDARYAKLQITNLSTSSANTVDVDNVKIQYRIASDELDANLALTGNATSTTASSTDNSTRIATTAFVKAAAANLTHVHAISDVTGLQTALDGKSNTSHVHAVATQNTAGFMSATDKLYVDRGTGTAVDPANVGLPTGDFNTLTEGGNYTIGGLWANGITGAAAATHTGVLTIIRRLFDSNAVKQIYYTGSDVWFRSANIVSGTPSWIAWKKYTFDGHVHAISDVSGLQTALDGKANLTHTHAISDVTSLQTTLDNKSNLNHTHAAANTTASGFMSNTDKVKLDGIATGATNYTHPTGDGNLHVPATGTSNNGNVLKAGNTAGSLSWGTLTKTDVGLANVDNTSDLSKPVSTAQQTALDGKANLVHTHADANTTASGFLSGADKLSILRNGMTTQPPSTVGLSTTNFDDLIESGIFTISSTWTNGINGAASTSYSGVLQVIRRFYNSNFVKQIYYQTSDIWYRTLNNDVSAWTAWRKLSFDDHTHAAATQNTAGFMSATDKLYVDRGLGTAGRPNALGMPTLDFDTIIEGGIYTITSNWTNGPSGAASTTYTGTMQVLKRDSDSNLVKQMFHTGTTIYYRVGSRSGGVVTFQPWKQISFDDHTHAAATTSTAGFMSSTDKTRLDYAMSLLQYPSVVGASGYNVPSTATYIMINGYTTAGDGGGARYKKSVGPAALGKFQTADGAWWELDEWIVTPEMYGALGNGTGNDAPALNAAFASKRQVGMAAKTYRITERVTVPSGAKIQGSSYKNEWNISRTVDLTGTVILAAGTFTRDLIGYGITDDRSSGGRIPNTTNSNFGSTDEYLSLMSFYNDDANATTGAAATAKPFSAAVRCPVDASGIRMVDVRIVLNHSGVDGYNNKTLTFGDDIDVGLYIDNTRNSYFENVQAVGYWRRAGMLMRTSAIPSEVPSGGGAGCENNLFLKCLFQGWKSASMRAASLFRVTAVGSNYVEIPWQENHPFDPAIHNRFVVTPTSPTSYPYTGVSKVGDKLRLTGVTFGSNPVNVADILYVQQFSDGVAMTVFMNCRFMGMSHFSGRRCSDPAITGALPPSATLEISGLRVRGPQFSFCKFQTHDDILVQLHQTGDPTFAPNTSSETNAPVGTYTNAGGRWIATSPTSAWAPYPIGTTLRCNLQLVQDGGDFSPAWGTYESKFNTVGFFEPSALADLPIIQKGIYFGDYNNVYRLSKYMCNGFTQTIQATTNNDLTFTGVSRNGDFEQIGGFALVNATFRGIPSYTTSSGNIKFMLTRPAITKDNYVAVLTCNAERITYPAGYTGIHAQILSGADHAILVFTGSGQLDRPMTVADLPASGGSNHVKFQISGTYRLE